MVNRRDEGYGSAVQYIIARVLIRHGADVNIEGLNSLFIAASYRNEAMMNLLRENGAQMGLVRQKEIRTCYIFSIALT